MITIFNDSFPDIFFLPEWGQLYASQDHGRAEIFEVKNELGHAFYQFTVRPIPLKFNHTQFYDTITPFGMGGPILLDCQPENKSRLVASFDKEFKKFCKKQNIVAEYIRFNPWLNNKEDFKSIYKFDKRGITVFIDLTVNDYFLDEFSSKARQQVRRAQKNEVKIEFDYVGENISEFFRIYNIMAKKNSIPSYYIFSEEFFKNSFRHLAGKQFIVFAKYGGRYISAAMFVYHGDYLHYLFAANDPEYFHVAANSLILDEGCKWGVQHHKKEMHLGGASTEELFRFKKNFTRTSPLDIITGKKVRDPEAYNQLSEARKELGVIEDLSYFPLYRA